MSELKPCPFCGKEAVSSKNFSIYDDLDEMWGCQNEDCVVNEMSWSDKEHWNTRPIEDALRARIAELEADIKDQRWDFVATMENVNKRYIAEGCKVEKLQKECDDKKARIAELEAAQRWIPVSERLPEVKEDCLFLCFIDGVSRRFVDARTWFADAKMFTSSNVTHWMPLPPPPEEERC